MLIIFLISLTFCSGRSFLENIPVSQIVLKTLGNNKISTQISKSFRWVLHVQLDMRAPKSEDEDFSSLSK